jgi:hypothetical protein
MKKLDVTLMCSLSCSSSRVLGKVLLYIDKWAQIEKYHAFGLGWVTNAQCQVEPGRLPSYKLDPDLGKHDRVPLVLSRRPRILAEGVWGGCMSALIGALCASFGYGPIPRDILCRYSDGFSVVVFR